MQSSPSHAIRKPKRVLLLGATGTIGRATAHALNEAGHDVVCLVRPQAGIGGKMTPAETAKALAGTDLRFGDPADPVSIAGDGIRGEAFDALVTCLASRTGVPADAWAIDHGANSSALKAARDAGIQHIVLLSAICVQHPLLAFQKAKLAFEAELIASGITYSIVRPTAFFKSLSGQFERVRAGKPYLMFGDGKLTACKPISDGDLARFIARCLDDDSLKNRILPIGGPGPAITPLEQGNALFAIFGRKPVFKRVPVRLLSTIAAGLGILGRFNRGLAAKAELARIGHYYATQSMLVRDPASGNYDADLTPETGTETLFNFYRRLSDGAATIERGDHAVF